MAKWEAGIQPIKATFKATTDRIDQRVAEREEDLLTSIWDSLAGLPDWATDGYDKAEKDFSDAARQLAYDVAAHIDTVIGECETLIADAHTEIKALFDALPADLQTWATEQQTTFTQELDALSEEVTQTQTQLVQGLASNCNQAIEEVQAQVAEFREKAKGLIEKAADAIVEFAEDPARAIINGLLHAIGMDPGSFWSIVDRISVAVEAISDDPQGFADNLLTGISAGFESFTNNIGAHLKTGLFEWLLGDVDLSVEDIPSDFNLSGLLKLALQVMGLSWDGIKDMIAKKLGISEEVAMLEQAYEVVQTFMEQGIDGILNMIREQLSPETIAEMIRDAVIDMVVETLATRAAAEIAKVMAAPVGGILKGVEMIYSGLKWVIDNAERIMSLVETVLGGIEMVIAGDTAGMAAAIEATLAGLIPPVTDLFAGMLGVGDLPEKIAGVITNLRESVQRQLDKVIDWVIKKAKSLFNDKGKANNGAAAEDNEEPTLLPEEGVAQVKQRLNAEGGKLAGKENKQAGAWMQAFYEKESRWVTQSVINKRFPGNPSELLLIPKQDEDSYWVEVRINPTEVTTKWPKGTGGVAYSNRGQKVVGMFHGSSEKIESVPDIDLNRLRGRGGDGRGLELGSGLYLTHYFHDSAGYVTRKKIHGKDGWVHKFLIPETLMQSAREVTPDPSAGDAAWEGIGDVVKGQWLHIGSNQWKAGYQWVVRTQKGIDQLDLEGALTPYEAADKWGRGRRNEFPSDFGRGLESVNSGRSLARSGSRHNSSERDTPQTTGVSSSSGGGGGGGGRRRRR